jgi:hypothetical protein
VIGCSFDGLEMERNGQPRLVFRGQIEVGASFSTGPDLRIWKIRLPWLAGGYQFGDAVSGCGSICSFRFEFKEGGTEATVSFNGRLDARRSLGSLS